MKESENYQEELDKILIELLGIITHWNKKITVCIASMLTTTTQKKAMIEYLIENKDNKQMLREDKLLQKAMEIQEM